MARVLARTRLQEYFDRILRDQMLASTSYIASLHSLQLSVILHGSAFVQSPDAMLRKATGILEVLTGQKPGVLKVDPLSTDPMVKDMSEGERRESEKAASSAVLAKLNRNRPASAKKITSAAAVAAASKNRKGAKGKAIATKNNNSKKEVTDGEFKAAKSATQLCCDLHGHRMWYFLEKLREFYLPDILASNTEQSMLNLRYGHDCTVPRKKLAGWFDVWTRAIPGKPLRPVRQDENPEEAVATYILPTADLLRFPDIELFYEQLAGAGGSNHSIDGLNVIVRPTLKVTTPMPKQLLEEQQQQLFSGWQPDKLVLMNWLLGHFFNPYMQRAHHHAAAPAPRFYPTDRPSFR